MKAIFGPAGNSTSVSARRLAARKSRLSITAEVKARWFTIEPLRGCQCDPVWRAKCSAAWSRKYSMLLRRSISVMPSAVRRSSSTERISEPSWSRWLRFCACSLSSSSRSIRSLARWKRLTVDHSRSSRSGSRRVSLKRRDECVEDVGDGSRDDTGFGQRSRVGFVLEGAIAVELEFGKDVIGRGCGVWRLVVVSRCARSSWWLPFVGSAAPIAAFMATKGGGRTGPAPPSAATAAVAQRRMAGAGYFASRCKARLDGRDGK